MRLKAPVLVSFGGKAKPLFQAFNDAITSVKVIVLHILCYSVVVCSAAKIILFSSVYAIACIIMRSFAEWACVFIFKVSNTCGCGRFSSILRIGMVQMFCSINLNNFTML